MWSIPLQTQPRSNPRIPSKIMGNALALAKPTPKTRHPFQRYELGDELSITTLRDHTSDLRKCIDLRTLDVTIRIWWRVLPTHYFFWRRDDDPTRRYCAHDCPAIETYRHLFSDCKHSSILWNIVLRQWRTILDHQPTWKHALFGLDLPLMHRWRRQSNGVFLAWNITRNIVFTLVWHRNQYKHQNETPASGRPSTTAADHIRHALRNAVANEDTALCDGLIRVLHLRHNSSHTGAETQHCVD